MNIFFLVITLSCGVPVSIMADAAVDAEQRGIVYGAVPPEHRQFWLEQIKIMEASQVPLKVIKVEEVLNLKWPVKT